MVLKSHQQGLSFTLVWEGRRKSSMTASPVPEERSRSEEDSTARAAVRHRSGFGGLLIVGCGGSSSCTIPRIFLCIHCGRRDRSIRLPLSFKSYRYLLFYPRVSTLGSVDYLFLTFSNIDTLSSIFFLKVETINIPKWHPTKNLQGSRAVPPSHA